MNSRLPWTKLQDFYLRLGFLKLLVATLSPERRSVTNDAIIRRLEHALFGGGGSHPSSESSVGTLSAAPGLHKAGGARASAEIVESLVSHESVGSALYAITKGTTYKILDWGRDMGFVGRANQITERALLLRSFLPLERAERFLGGDTTAWNPFELSPQERLFFLFHLLEHDLVTVDLISDLAALPADTVVEAREASRMTCSALFRVLGATERLHDAKSMQAHRIAVDLALIMAEEVDAPVPSEWSHRASRVRFSRDLKAASRRGVRAAKSGGGTRKTTKNADHQTIPRFEQLVDLGFLAKPHADAESATTSLAARKRWRYCPTSACRRWARAYQQAQGEVGSRFDWSAFAAVAVKTFESASSAEQVPLFPETIGARLWNSYLAVGRPVGLSPVDSIALRATIDAAAEGVAMEMNAVHELLLKIKQRSLLTDCVMFAAGNALDTMFVRLRPTFPQRLHDVVGELSKE